MWDIIFPSTDTSLDSSFTNVKLLLLTTLFWFEFLMWLFMGATWHWYLMHFLIAVSVIFCEAVAIYGVIVAIILQTKLESVPPSQLYAPESLRAGYAIFASGIIVGFANLVCGCVPSLSLFSKPWSPAKLIISFTYFPLVNLILIFFHVVQAVCRNHWKQLCLIWCTELFAFCEDSCDWNLRQCTWVVWRDSRDNHVGSSNVAFSSLVCFSVWLFFCWWCQLSYSTTPKYVSCSLNCFR